MMRNFRFWVPTLVGAIATPFMIGIALVSAGVGHGSYFPMLVFYPLSSFLLFLQPHNLEDAFLQQILENILMALSFGLAIIQFPFYGFITSYANIKKDSAFLIVYKGIIWLHIVVSGIFVPIILAGMFLGK
ncbi:MAG: hypothetical protein QOC96_1992 [Acidobacteriota bacterium]|jgi:hypothetical protein|nr:hypothetical protein [Acidobacteriota bacterium]